MALSEIFYMVAPIAWLLLSIFVIKDEPVKKFFLWWFVMVIVCLTLGVIMAWQISHMMGGNFSLAEGLYYGWFLTGGLIVFQIFKKLVIILLNKFITCPNQLARQILIWILYYGLLFIFIVPYFLAMTSVHRVKVGDALDPKTALSLDFQDVSWKTEDGLNIKGWFIPAASNKAVLIAHGLGANKSNFIGTVDLWHHMGFNVLIFDFRGHGESDGHTVNFGYKERLDIIGGWNYLTQDKKFNPKQIVGYGASFGGAAMIHAANQIHGFDKLIIDSSFASLDDMAMHIIEQESFVPSFLRRVFKEMALFFVRIDLGFDIREQSPENVIGKLAGTPILFIHGIGDPLISWKQSERLYARAGEPKQIFILNTQGHLGTMNDINYREIILTFLNSGRFNDAVAKK